MIIPTFKRTAALLLLAISAGTVHAESIEKFHNQYYTQMCTSLIACYNHIDVAKSMHWLGITNVDACVTVLAEGNETEKWREPLTNKTLKFKPSAGHTCLSAVADLSCDKIGKLGRNIHKPSFVKGCEAVLVGAIENSEKCSSNLECKANDASCYTTCEPLPTTDQCGDDTCTVASEYCDYKTTMCIVKKDIGAACESNGQCKDDCVAGLCKAPFPVVKPGGQCGKGYGHICSIGEFCAEDQCKPYRTKGESCSTVDNKYMWCEAPFTCTEDKCV